MLQPLVVCKAWFLLPWCCLQKFHICPGLKLGILMESSVCRKPQQIFIFGSLQELEVTSRMTSKSFTSCAEYPSSISRCDGSTKIRPVTIIKGQPVRSPWFTTRHTNSSLAIMSHRASRVGICWSLDFAMSATSNPQRCVVSNTHPRLWLLHLHSHSQPHRCVPVALKTENPVGTSNVSLLPWDRNGFRQSPERPYQGYVHHSRPQYLHHQSPCDWRCS